MKDNLTADDLIKAKKTFDEIKPPTLKESQAFERYLQKSFESCKNNYRKERARQHDDTVASIQEMTDRLFNACDENYIPPVTIYTQQIVDSVEDDIYKTVIGYGVDVDRNELIRALTYDREQYKQGYHAGVVRTVNLLRAMIQKFEMSRTMKDELEYIFRGILDDARHRR